MYLLDTNVISELRRPSPNRAVVAWVEAVPMEQLFVSAVTIGEIQSGIEMTRMQDPEKAAALEAWLDQISQTFSVIPMDALALREWGRIRHRRSNTLLEDAMLAATASVHQLRIVTRNTRDFHSLGVEVINPFKP